MTPPAVTTPRPVTTQVEAGWRAYWDPESEILILTLTSAILAGIGIALIMMGAAPAPAQALVDTVAGPAVEADREPVGEPGRPRSKPARTPSKSGDRKVPVLGPSLPRTLDIPSIGVHTPVMSLGLESDGTVEVPPLKRNAPAGWYRNLATPGEAGPAVILGHVDSARDGPAIFYRLKELRPGARLSVDRVDGSRVYFTVRSVVRYPKKDFPTASVYGYQPGSELRLVTCGGSFDALRGHYRDNLVVYAAMTGSTAATARR
jgi:sortase (surface protein transpeptidase)